MYRAIIPAALTAGTLDITAACISTFIKSGKPPAAVFRYIAAAAFGKSAFKGGWDVILAGCLFHYLIAFAFTIAFFLAYPRLKRFVALPAAIIGMLYGVLAWCIMNLLVLPLTALAPVNQSASQVIVGISFLVFLIGLPISLFAARFYSNPITTAAVTNP